MTEVTIQGTDFYIDGKPTYEGRVFEGKHIEGMLFNVRAVQATFDDENPETAKRWAYPDTGVWDAERNVNEFCAALPAWRDHGVLAFTTNFQGGGALYSEEIYNSYRNNAYHLNGELKTAYSRRMKKILDAADDLGMVVIVGFFYWKQSGGMTTEGIENACRQTCQFLRDTGKKNFLIEVANESRPMFPNEILREDQVHHLIQQFQVEFPEMLFSVSLGGVNITRHIPSQKLVAVSDYVLLHGNQCTPQTLKYGIDQVRSYPAYRKSPKPIIVNEDSPGMPNFDISWQNGVSWGYYDQGYGGKDGYGFDSYVDFKAHDREDTYGELSGFQTPPVNWGINTPEKKAFFDRVAEITGYSQ
ncbi:MAG: hypothetical protein V2J07_00055 [Anaerolineae bacterium]|jgi:hypothetical protein|nr:hypothetical protein [Anaerolineae bacterium]